LHGNSVHGAPYGSDLRLMTARIFQRFIMGREVLSKHMRLMSSCRYQIWWQQHRHSCK
jgi:hypothetical protein